MGYRYSVGVWGIAKNEGVHLLSIPDDAIARALVADDRAVFEAIAIHMRPILTLTCAAHVGSQAAEDAVQEVLLKIWQHRARYDPARSGFSTWAVAIARNTAIDHRRALARRRDALSSLAREIAPSPPLCEETAMASETSREVRVAAGGLDHHQREAVFHAFWLGRTHREIAGAMSLPLGTVKGRVRIGLGRMRLALEQEPLVAGATPSA